MQETYSKIGCVNTPLNTKVEQNVIVSAVLVHKRKTVLLQM